MKSRLLAKAMEQVLEGSQFEFKITFERDRLSCARGALMYNKFQEDTLPPRMRFFLSREEYYEEEIHGSNAKRGESRWCDKGTVIAKDRIARILDFDNGIASNEKPVAMTYLVAEAPRGRLHADLFWSEDLVEEHGPVKDRASRPLKGIREFPLSWIDLPDLSSRGFKAVDGNGPNDRHFVLKAWVGLEHKDDKLILTIKIMRPGYRHPWKLDGSLRQNRRNSKARAKVPRTIARVPQKDVFMEQEMEVWARDSSHFVTSTTGTCISRGDFIHEDMKDHVAEGIQENVPEDADEVMQENVPEDVQADVQADEDEDIDDEDADTDDGTDEDTDDGMDEDTDNGMDEDIDDGMDEDAEHDEARDAEVDMDYDNDEVVVIDLMGDSEDEVF